MTISSHRQLDVRQRSIELGLEIYRTSYHLPAAERFGLRSQVQRSAVSVASSIAEGHGRRGPGECLQFLGVSRGSLGELDTHLEFVERLGYRTRAQLVPSRDLAE